MFVFLDTETTDTDEPDRLCSVHKGTSKNPIQLGDALVDQVV